MDRRDFMKITAATGVGATLEGCSDPATQLVRFIPDEPLYPGIATWKPSICPLCRAGCGIQVRVMDGDVEVERGGQAGIQKRALAKKLEGNPAHPVSQGKLCVRGQAAIQLTYHPDRIRQPLKRTGSRGSGPYQAISWDEAMSDLRTRLDQLADAKDQRSLGFLTGPLRGQRRVMVSQFLQRFGAPPPVEFEVFSEDVSRKANARSFGYEQLPTVDLARSRYVLSFGADFLGTWNSPVAQNISYGEMRQGRPGERAKFVQVESRMSQTGANADEWVPVKPGTEGILALGIAHVILRSSGTRELPNYTPEEVEKRTGVAAARVERLAQEFSRNRPAVAIIGGAPLAHTNGMFHALAVNALNALVGSAGVPGGIFFTPQLAKESVGEIPSRSLREVASQILSSPRSPIQLLLLHDVNPIFGSPPAWRMREALSRIPYIVSFGSFLDETSMLADLILPDHSFLESWIDHTPESGTLSSVASVASPVMRPLHNTRSMPDVLIDAGRMLRRPVSLDWKSYEEFLEKAFRSLPSLAGAAQDSWSLAQQQGGWWGESSKPAPIAGARFNDPSAAFAEPQFAEPQFDGPVAEYPLHFLPYASQAFLDGSLAHLPWLQELPDVVSTAMWSCWVEIHPKTAAQYGIAQGDMVEIASSQGTIQAPALLSPGIAPDIVAMPVGQGHETFTRYASGRGTNPLSILAPLVERETGALAWAATRVRIARAQEEGRIAEDKRLVLFAGGLKEHEERPR
jgi:menaquinone reductase, molybdopterin-binding-like subunit